MILKFQKRTVVLIAILSVVAILVSGWIYSAMTLPDGEGIEISGQAVDNDYNNYLAGGSVVRIGDTVYCSYAKNAHAYGIMEISEQGVRRIYWDGNKSLIAGYAPPQIRAYDGKLLLHIKHSGNSQIPEGVMCYNPATQTFEKLGEIHGIIPDNIQFQQIDDLFVCPIYRDMNHKSLYWQRGEECGTIENIYVFSYYATETAIFYHASKKDEQPNGIWKYDIESQTEELLLPEDTSTLIYSILTANHDFAILHTYNGICKVYFESPIRIETLVENYNSVCMYENSIFIASENGVGCYDLKTNTYRMLVDQKADECYVVDDQWVYIAVYSDGIRSPQLLYRVKQDGTTFEKVYG